MPGLRHLGLAEPAHLPHRAALLVAGVISTGVLATAGCGSSDSSSPSYCSSEADLQQSVDQLAEVNVVKGGTDALSSAVKKVQDDATATVDAAKQDFPSETSALNQSVSALQASVKQLSDPQQATKAVAAIPGEIQSVSNAVTSFTNATESKCS
jgi:hypothetical protein